MRAAQLKTVLPRELLASVVVFLVALPLCMGIAIASGMPPAKGLLTGIIGGLVVGWLAGSPLQVSGPAAGLAVLVFELVRQHGMLMLGPILLLAGFLQLVAGRLRLGCWFRVTAPAVVYGMLAGIGIGLATQMAFSLWRSHRHSLQLARYDDHYVLRIQQNLTFMHNPHLLALLAKIPEKSVVIVEHDSVGYLDPDVRAVLDDFAENAPQRGIRLNQWPLASR